MPGPKHGRKRHGRQAMSYKGLLKEGDGVRQPVSLPPLGWTEGSEAGVLEPGFGHLGDDDDDD